MADGEKADIGILEVDARQETGVQELVIDGFCSDVTAGEKERGMVENVSWSIEDDMGKVSLVGESGPLIDIYESGAKSVTMDGNDDKTEAVTGESGNLNGVGESGMKSETIDGNGEKKEAVSGESGNLNVIGESGTKSETIDGDGEKKEAASDEDESESLESESTSASSSSPSSSCSSSDDDDDDDEDDDEDEDDDDDDDDSDGEAEERRGTKEGEAGEVEEGEIKDVVPADADGDAEAMVGWHDRDDEDGDTEAMAGRSDIDDEDGDTEAMAGWSDMDDEDAEEGDGIKGPIRSKNEAKVLPPVPPVEATLLPHHLVQPVGVVLSIVGTQVVVEGVENHSPLSDGSILWITESRSPLGIVDEIFGPVKNPYYIVRYNSEAEVPAGISAGTSVSFVPEFASHVLNNKDIHKKGYDASGANDEELSDDGEFSDDEKESEFKRMQKASKRGTTDQKPRKNKSNKKSFGSRGEPWRGGKSSPPHHQTPMQAGPIPPNQHQFQPFPNLPPMWPNAPPNGVWSNGMPLQQPQGMFFPPNGFPMNNNMTWPPQNPQQYPYQMPMPSNVMPFNPQVNPNQSLPFGQGFVGQSGFNAIPFGMMGLPGQPSPANPNLGQQGIASSGLVMGSNFNIPQSGGVPGNNEAPQQFNPSPSGGRGRGSYRRGGGRFSRGRGRNQ